jgi:DNA helicase II / ATP-dependent DNA helicase PcrA
LTPLMGRENTTLVLFCFMIILTIMKISLFEEKYKKLNAKQKEAVDAIEGPVMVIAGPGTGKTTILTLRIANILRLTDTPASGILALTFTEAGAKTMRNKLHEIIGERAFEVAIHTFHGFAASVLSEFGDHFPHLARSKQITDIESESLLREILKQKNFSKLRPPGDPDFYVAKIIGAVSDCKQEDWTPEMLRSFVKDEIERIKNNPESISSQGQSKGKMKAGALKRIEKCERTAVFADVYETYEKKKRDERKIDFDDLIFELLQALRKDKLLLQILQEKFLYILLDEHQDTNDTQNLIIKHLADFFDTPNLFVVGDEKQAIYRFQGASIENFLGFQKIWSGMKIISLSENYRSHQHILDASFRMIEKNYGEKEHEHLRIKLKSGVKEKNKPLDLIAAPDEESEETYLVKTLKNLIQKDKKSSVAIIVRKNSGVARIFALLEEHGIPASAERGANIFSHPAGVLYFYLLEFLKDPGNTEALATTFALGLWHIDFKKKIELIKYAKNGKMGEIEKEVPIISGLQKEMARTGAIEFLYLAADLSGFTEMVMKDLLSVEIWRGIVALAEDLVHGSNIENPKDLIERLLDYKKSAERRVIKINTGQTLSQITIMTAHGSKGLEFDYVFLPFATEESWIHKNRGSYFVLPKEKKEDDDIKDERRLFYVAMTRARKHVSISFSDTPIRFIDELDQKLLSHIELPKTAETKILKSLEKIKAGQSFEEVEYSKRVLLENGLSVTALNHFIECPNKFFYKSILKLPEPPSASSEKGSAMHEALARIWKDLKMEKLKDYKTKKVAGIIVDSVTNYLKNSFIPVHEKESVLDELITNALKVAIALKGHFSQQGKVHVESWVETPFKNITIHGKLDTLIEQENKIFIYDYKTREAMSQNAIKGETKASTGDYFRQLVFYKILLEGNYKFKNKIIEPALVFVKPDDRGRCPIISLPVGKQDEEKVKMEISNLIESVWSGKFLTTSCSDPACKYCGYRKLL